MFALIEQHPEIRFDLFFPPYSILSYVADHYTWKHAFAERQAFKRFVVTEADRHPNAHVFDFQGIEEITHDFTNYKDLEHYDLEVNEYILKSLATGRHAVSAATYESELKAQAAQVDRGRSLVP